MVHKSKSKSFIRFISSVFGMDFKFNTHNRMVSCVRARFYVGVEMLQADKQQTQTYFNNNKKSEWNQAELISERFVDIFIIANKSFAFSLPQQNIVLEIGKRKVLYKLIALRRRIVHICLFAFNAHTHHIQRNSNSV